MGQLTSTDLVSAIVKKTSLTESQVAQMVSDFKVSFAYENETNILKLLAQELNINTGSPHDYLYILLEYCIEPLRVYIYPFSTIDKTKIKETFNWLIQTHKTKDNELAKTIIEKGISGWAIEPDEQFSIVFGLNGIVIMICILEGMEFPDEYESTTQSYKELMSLRFKTYDYIDNLVLETLKDCTFNEIIDKAHIKFVFSGHRVLFEKGKSFIPISVLEDEIFSNLDQYLICERPQYAPEFPFISLEPLKDEENLEVLRLPCTSVREIKGLEVLRNKNSIKRIHIEGLTLISFDLPALGVLPNLEEIWLYSNALEYIDLSSLSQSPKLKVLELGFNRLQNIDLSPLMHSSALEYFSLIHNKITDIDLSPLRYCKKLKELRLVGNPIESFNLNPLLSCVELAKVELRETYNNPLATERELPPLVNGPQKLTVIGYSESDQLNLSDKEVLTELANLETSLKEKNYIKQSNESENNGLFPFKSKDFSHLKLLEVGKKLSEKDYITLEKDFQSDPDSVLFAIHMAVIKGSPIHDPNWISEPLDIPKNALGFLGLSSCYSNPNVLNLLRRIIRNGDEVHPDVWNFASMKFSRYLNDNSFSHIHADLSNEYFIGKIKHDQFQKFLRAFLEMYDPTIESSDPFELFKNFLANPDVEYRVIVFKFLINMYFSDLNILVANIYLGMNDPSKKVRNIVKKTLSDRFGSKEKAENFIQEILSSPQEQLDEILKEVHSR